MKSIPLDLRCAEVARADGYRPAGTAASAPVFLLIEVPLPWPADVADHAFLGSVAPIAAAHRARIQALVPGQGEGAAGSPPGMSRVIAYHQPPGPFRRYERRECVVPTSRLAEETAVLLDSLSGVHDGAAILEDGDPSPSDGGGASPVGSDADGAPDPVVDGLWLHRDADGDGAGRRPARTDVPQPVIDVLVCTHGSRDVCCGSGGMRVYRDLVALAVPGVRVWRTSHTGGHRFAPTAVTFPDGRAWASLDAELLAGIVTRSLASATAAQHDRGCAAFGDPFAQVAEAAAFAVEGWAWLDHARTVEITRSAADDRRTATVTARPIGTSNSGTGNGDSVSGEPVVYRVEVAVSRVVPVPDCGRPLAEARKSSTELEVVSLERLSQPQVPRS